MACLAENNLAHGASLDHCDQNPQRFAWDPLNSSTTGTPTSLYYVPQRQAMGLERAWRQ